MSKIAWLFAILVGLVAVGDIFAHPQCLDYFPPFTSSRPVGFCKESSKYGCCSSKREKTLFQVYQAAVRRRIRARETEKCDEFVRNILCAECHPYAAHIYDAENPPKEVNKFSKISVRFPGLCLDFCLASFQSCRNTLLALPMRLKFRRFMRKASARSFCTWAVSNDKDYCFPNVNKVKNQIFLTEKNKEQTTMCVQPIIYDLFNPIFAVPANDGTHRMFIGEQRGLVHVVDHQGKRLGKPFLNIEERILNSGQGWDERGLLGFTFHPKYASNGRFFVYYSVSYEDKNIDLNKRNWYFSPKHKIRIAEYTVSPENPNTADNTSEITLLEINEPEANHEGGMLLFGDDGYLYIFVGDGGGAGDRHGSIGNALNVSTLLGKVLRINVDVYDGRRYAIPPDNPFIKTKHARDEIYAYGMRNPWRCSKDRGNRVTRDGKGRIFCGDVGQDKYEEIDIIVKGGNYGWRAMEANSCYDETLCKSPNFDAGIPPIISYNHSYGKSIVGGYVYRGCSNPNMQGTYFYADTVSGRIFSATEDVKTKKWFSKEVKMGNASQCNNRLFGFYAKTILSFAEDEAGEIYILSTQWPSASRPFGAMYRLVDPTRRDDPERCRFKAKSPTPLKSVRKRYIGPIRKRSKNKSVCIDRRHFCRHVLVFPRLCIRYKAITRLFCPKSCRFC